MRSKRLILFAAGLCVSAAELLGLGGCASREQRTSESNNLARLTGTIERDQFGNPIKFDITQSGRGTFTKSESDDAKEWLAAGTGALRDTGVGFGAAAFGWGAATGELADRTNIHNTSSTKVVTRPAIGPAPFVPN